MPDHQTVANRIIAGDPSATACVQGIIRLKSNNLVERPWGGLKMLDFKGCAPLPDQKRLTGMGIGESFEVAACGSDQESNAYPSQVLLPDNSVLTLPQLLAKNGRNILGTSLYQKFGGEIPLLPKILDIEELLSVQAHPPGNTELYVIIDAQPGASIRLGFQHNVDPDALRQQLAAGRRRQEELLLLLNDSVDQHALHNVLAATFSDPSGSLDTALTALLPLIKRGVQPGSIRQLLQKLYVDYWQVLDLMNEIVVRPGQIIYNATPARVCTATGRPPSAEVHALGNPERREILMLEIRRPGVTYRAWDNVRFPVRDIDINQTIDALHLGATSPAEFEITPSALAESPGCYRCVNDANFVVDYLRPKKNLSITVKGDQFHTLHALHGCVLIKEPSGNTHTLAPGESAIAPATLGSYQISSESAAELIRVSLPDE